MLELIDDDSIRTSRWSEQPIAPRFESLGLEGAAFVVWARFLGCRSSWSFETYVRERSFDGDVGMAGSLAPVVRALSEGQIDLGVSRAWSSILFAGMDMIGRAELLAELRASAEHL